MIGSKFKLIAALVLGTALFPSGALGAVVDWQKGFTMTPWGPDDFAQPWFLQSMDNLAAIHADTVALTIPYYQSSFTSHDIQAGPHTPTDESLAAAVAHARASGLKVVLKPHIQILGNDGWRAWINPDDRAAWFAAYKSILLRYARFAEQHGADALVLGTELINMTEDSVHSENTARWRDIIAAVREVYRGKLTYSANWGASGWYDEKNQIEFWDSLDFIGISAYFPLAGSTSYTTAEIVSKWDSWNSSHIRPLAAKWGKDVVFTEVGYRSKTGALVRPPRFEAGGEPNEQEQFDAYNALFTYWNEQPFMKGMYAWDWQNDPHSGGPNDTGFTVQNKIAQGLVTNWFGNGNPPGPIISFGSSGSVSPQNPSAGDPVEMKISLTNRGSVVSSAVVDIEIADGRGTQVFQKTFENQVLLSQEEKNFAADWTPELPGSYSLRIGVFSSDWKTVHYWKEILTFPVGGGTLAAPVDIVLYASDVDEAAIHGTWMKVADPTAANEILIRDKNNEAPKLTTAAPAPENYFDISFTAEANRPYHLWLRMRADENVYTNDSVHVQFSDSLDGSGAPAYRIGSTSSVAVVLEEGSGAGESEWGWNDGDYGSLGEPVTFAASGTHTLRVQQREDGVSIDQIMLSPERYLTERPGATKYDRTILVRAAPDPNVPTSTPTSTPSEPVATSTPSTATSGPPAVPTSTSALPTPVLSLWWPVHESWMGGIQPFKAMIEDRDAATYSVIWQVDGGVPNGMSLSTEVYPHYEAWVDLSPWRWRSDNNYVVTVAAQDLQGNVIATRSSTIHIYP